MCDANHKFGWPFGVKIFTGSNFDISAICRVQSLTSELSRGVGSILETSCFEDRKEDPSLKLTIFFSMTPFVAQS